MPSTTPYHHGDLRTAVLREALASLREHGIEGLSLRKLATRVGVTAPALYHHFRDKNDLLCALAERGFEEMEQQTTSAGGPPAAIDREWIRRFVRAYVDYATKNPEIYDLMFGRTIWKAGVPTATLRQVAHAAFRRYVELSAVMMGSKSAKSRSNLRTAQAGWAALHGLCRLLIDGVYAQPSDLEAMTAEVVELLWARAERNNGA